MTPIGDALTLVNQARDHARTGRPFTALDCYGRAIASLEASGSPSPSTVNEAEQRIEAELDQPSHRLVIYGTLAPGEPNHHMLHAVEGPWHRGQVRGRRDTYHRLPTFVSDPDGPFVDVWILCSASLPRAYTSFLDDFEGALWPRHLTVAESTALGAVVANVYEFVG